MNAADPLSIDTLGQRHPEWSAWLSVLRVVRSAMSDPAWAAAIPAAPIAGDTTAPLVSGAVLSVDGGLAARFVDALVRTAGAAALGPKSAVAVLDAAVAQDREQLLAIATTAGIEGALLVALAPLAASPLLQACARAWHARVPPHWDGAACPVCGAWAAVMEARGVERVYRLRCARCGADWGAEPVRCPYCGERDHEKLVGLVSDGKGDVRRVEACTVCLGYVKSVTTLTACAPEDVGLLDLSTVELDVAALEHGYTRPARPAFSLATRVVARPRGGWRGLLGRRR
jgi:FdhE protein